jgi:lipopolysaccharide/colanic/teichoic acid biosynthesis glycosyltransferase/nucleoside-diphosphate-sugar epimerase
MHRHEPAVSEAECGVGTSDPALLEIKKGFYARWGKRVLDIVPAIFGLIFLAPILLLIACVVKLTSRGPILFRQVRVGRRGVPFKIVKFRTMSVGASARGFGITVGGDARITTLGRFLRRYKLDELPQLWNVLAGEMSFVGPRPELPVYVARYSPLQRGVLALRPGITGTDAVAYSDEEELLAAAPDAAECYEDVILPDKLGLSSEYLEKLSVRKDLEIIIETLKSVIRAAKRPPRSSNAFRVCDFVELLGREPVAIDLKCARWLIEGRSVLVTGAAGSIGSELCRQIVRLNPKRLVCLDYDAGGIERLQRMMAGMPRSDRARFVVADVGDRRAMRGCLAKHNIDFIFHAAAHKHLPALESRVAEAVRNNVFVLDALLETAEERGCHAFVLISSDKAVNPSSVMGATKRIGELMLAARPQRGMRCVAVRFGNVLGSSGSVVPILQEQLRRGLPLTITHPESKRFFMAGSEAVSLALEAVAIGAHGEILVLEMGAPVKIVDLAERMIRLSRPDSRAASMRFTGLRAGEKLVEELFYPQEVVERTAFKKIFCAKGEKLSWTELRQGLEKLRGCVNTGDSARLRAALREIVPEYTFEPLSNAEPTGDDAALSVLHAAHDEAS